MFSSKDHGRTTLKILVLLWIIDYGVWWGISHVLLLYSILFSQPWKISHHERKVGNFEKRLIFLPFFVCIFCVPDGILDSNRQYKRIWLPPYMSSYWVKVVWILTYYSYEFFISPFGLQLVSHIRKNWILSRYTCFAADFYSSSL